MGRECLQCGIWCSFNDSRYASEGADGEEIVPSRADFIENHLRVDPRSQFGLGQYECLHLSDLKGDESGCVEASTAAV
jgi:hypothetical protein